MMKKKRTLSLSLAGILLCVCLIVGGTYALYTDQATVSNHLEAGRLDLTLTRTALAYTVCNAETGYLEKVEVGEDKSFTDATEENIFGFSNGQALLMVPGSYFEATLEIGRAEGASVAFDAYAEIKLLEGIDEAFARQLLVTVIDGDGSLLVDGVTMQDILGGKVSLGRISPATPTHSFTVFVEFANLESNNDAKGQEVLFDLIVYAVQATNPRP